MRTLLFSNLFVAAGAAGLTWESEVRLGAVQPSWSLLLLVFGATLVVYNLDRLTSRAVEDRVRPSERLRWIAAHRRLLVLVSGVGSASVLGALVFLPGRVRIAVGVLGLVSLAYLAPMAFFGRRRLKEVPGLKVFVVALVWAAVTVGLPALAGGAGAGVAWYLGVERFLFVLAICLPFDVRDLERDRAAGIRTLPAWIGVEGTRRLAWGLLLAHALLVALSPSDPRLALLVTDGLTLGIVAAMRPQRGDLYYSLGVDGTMLVQAGLVLASRAAGA